MKVFPTKNEKIITIVISAFLFGLILGLCAILKPELAEELFPALTTLLAAFAGAWYAFRLHAKKSEQDEAKVNVKAANCTIFELVRWYNKLLAFKKQFLNEHLDNPWRQFYILPVAGMSQKRPMIDYDSLAFLIHSGKPNLLGTLSLAEQEVESTLDVIAQRSQLHVEVFQPTVEILQKQHGSAFAPELIDEALGEKNSQVIRMLTDYMIQGVDDSVAAIAREIDELRAQVLSMYPDHNIVQLIEPKTEQN